MRASGPERGDSLRLGDDSEYAHFADRADAGRRLAALLGKYATGSPLVLALPRGGLAVAPPIVAALGAELDVLVVQKLRVPSQPELAMGALAEGDVVLWEDEILEQVFVTDEEREIELERARAELAKRTEIYRRIRPRARVRDRTTIVVDDGIATGATIQAALRALVLDQPAELVVALPGGALRSLVDLSREPGVTEVVALAAPHAFFAVSQLYGSFPEVSTDQACAILRAAGR